VDVDALLSDSGIARIRSAQRRDVIAIRAMYDRVSDDTLYLRFFTFSGGVVAHEVEAQTRPAGDDHASLVAEIGGDVVGVASFERLDRDVAEIAFLVDDTHRARGVGMLLLEQLAATARARGIVKFVADTLPGNGRMLNLFADAGLPVTTEYGSGVIRVGLELRVDESFRSAVDRREALADAISLRRVLAPRSVVVVGVGPEPGDAGPQLLANIRRGGYRGELYAVGPCAEWATGAGVYADLDDVPGQLDLVIVAVPAAAVLGVAVTAAARGAAGLVVGSAGFSESDPSLPADLLRICRDGGLRLIGPHSTGICNTGEAVALNATFCVTPPPSGHIGLMSQSGTVGMAMLDYAARTGVGISTFVSVGDKADVSGNDLLCAWEFDETTTVCALYLESVGNRSKFVRIASRVGRHKPIVAIKPGRDVALDCLFERAGVTRVDSLSHLFGVATLFDLAPLPRGPRVSIVVDDRRSGERARDACSNAGLVVSGSDVVVTEPDAFDAALRAMLCDTSVDAIIAVCTPRAPDAEGSRIASVIGVLQAETVSTPLLACFVGLDTMPVELVGTDRRPVVPYYVSIEAAAHALAAAVRYARWRARPEGPDDQLEGLDARDEMVARVATFAENVPELLEIDLGASAHIRLGSAAPGDPPLRRLR